MGPLDTLPITGAQTEWWLTYDVQTRTFYVRDTFDDRATDELDIVHITGPAVTFKHAVEILQEQDRFHEWAEINASSPVVYPAWYKPFEDSIIEPLSLHVPQYTEAFAYFVHDKERVTSVAAEALVAEARREGVYLELNEVLSLQEMWDCENETTT